MSAVTAPSPANLTWEEAHRELVPLMRADNRSNIAYILLEYVLLGTFLATGALVWNSWQLGDLPLAGFVPLALAVIFAVAVVQHRFSSLGHEASHFTLFKNRWANELVSDFLFMFPVLALTQQFRATHTGHHRFVNDPVLDPDVKRLNQPWPRHWPMTPWNFCRRFVLGALWPPYLVSYLFGQAKNANIRTDLKLNNPYSYWAGRGMRTAYWLSVISVVYLVDGWAVFLLFWVAPLLTFYPFLMQLREIAHHSNAPGDGDLENSRVFLVNPLCRECVFPYGQAFHVTHHLFAMLPHYRMAEAHAILMRHPPYREQVVVCRGYFFRRFGTAGPSVLDVLARAS